MKTHRGVDVGAEDIDNEVDPDVEFSEVLGLGEVLGLAEVFGLAEVARLDEAREEIDETNVCEVRDMGLSEDVVMGVNVAGLVCVEDIQERSQ